MRPVSFEPLPIALDELTLPAQQYATSEYMVTGVYFLFRYGNLIYIGQSDNVLSRVASHRSSGRNFDSFSIFRCGKEWLLPLEAAFIRKFQPPENRAHTKADIHPLSDRDQEDQRHEDTAPQVSTKEWLRSNEAASHVGLSRSTLEKLRMDDGGPPFTRLGRAIIYRRSDLDSWLSAKRRTSTWTEPESA